MTVTERMKYMKDYRRIYNYKNKRKETVSEIFFESKFNYSVLKIEPSLLNFRGTDQNEPIVCSQFGCANHLTPEQQLYGSKCIHCQGKKKIDVTKFISHPIKKSA